MNIGDNVKFKLWYLENIVGKIIKIAEKDYDDPLIFWNKGYLVEYNWQGNIWYRWFLDCQIMPV